MKFTRRLAVIAAGALAVLVLPAAAMAAEPPPLPDHVPDAVASALFGGYQDYVGLNGPFTNPGDMIAYQQQGGAVYAAHPVISTWSTWSRFPSHANVYVSGSGWVPGSTVTGTLTVQNYNGPIIVQLTFTADSSGNLATAAYEPFGSYRPYEIQLSNSYGQSATASGVTSHR